MLDSRRLEESSHVVARLRYRVPSRIIFSLQVRFDGDLVPHCPACSLHLVFDAEF